MLDFSDVMMSFYSLHCRSHRCWLFSVDNNSNSYHLSLKSIAWFFASMLISSTLVQISSRRVTIVWHVCRWKKAWDKNCLLIQRKLVNSLILISCIGCSIFYDKPLVLDQACCDRLAVWQWCCMHCVCRFLSNVLLRGMHWFCELHLISWADFFHLAARPTDILALTCRRTPYKSILCLCAMSVRAQLGLSDDDDWRKILTCITAIGCALISSAFSQHELLWTSFVTVVVKSLYTNTFCNSEQHPAHWHTASYDLNPLL